VKLNTLLTAVVVGALLTEAANAPEPPARPVPTRPSVVDAVYGTSRVPAGIAARLGFETQRLSRLYAVDGITPELILAVVQVESEFKHRAVGTSGERGLMQIKPSTAKPIIRELGLPNDLFDVSTNLAVGTHYLASLHRGYVRRGLESPGEYHLTLLAYNAGPGSVDRALTGSRSIHLQHYRKVRHAMSAWRMALIEQEGTPTLVQVAHASNRAGRGL
jgi:soluble lytic murein transglycosylase-like protein